MKKFLTVLMCLLILSGCENKQDVKTEPLIFSGFTCAVTTEMNNVVISANVSYDCAAGFDFTLTSPETLSGIKVKGVDGVFTLTGEGLTLEFENENLNPECIFKALGDCVSSVLGAYPVSVQGDEQIYAYKTEDAAGTLETYANGNFKVLTVNGTKFTFDGFSFTKQ